LGHRSPRAIEGEDPAMTRSRLAPRAVLPILPLVVAAVLFSSWLPVASAAPESKDAVKITATADKPDSDGKQTVTITIDIQKPWHLYANPVKNEDMVNSQTVVKITANDKPLDKTAIKYPTGTEKKDATVGNYMIYEGKIEITATVRRAKDDTNPLEAAVTLSACDETKCLMPSTVKVKVEPK
jgi:hypothetical protein